MEVVSESNINSLEVTLMKLILRMGYTVIDDGGKLVMTNNSKPGFRRFAYYSGSKRDAIVSLYNDACEEEVIRNSI